MEDGTLIGPYDLSGSLGYPGEYNKKDVKDAIKKVIDKCREHKVPSGFHVVDTNPEELILKIDQGCRFLAYGIDHLFLKNCAISGMNKIKKIKKMNIISIIPARMASTRFPGKPMKDILGIPMIGHVYKRVKMNKTLQRWYVATCDEEIFDYIESIGGKAVMTSDQHERCTDRCAEAMLKIENETGQTCDIMVIVR